MVHPVDPQPQPAPAPNFPPPPVVVPLTADQYKEMYKDPEFQKLFGHSAHHYVTNSPEVTSLSSALADARRANESLMSELNSAKNKLENISKQIEIVPSLSETTKKLAAAAEETGKSLLHHRGVLVVGGAILGVITWELVLYIRRRFFLA